MRGYYDGRLAGRRLERCYDIAPPRIRRYLEAEVRFVAERVRAAERVLELGCGYGRVMKRLSVDVAEVVGCDTAHESLAYARTYMEPRDHVALVRADAVRMPFRPGAFDATVCVQNGISAFGVDPRHLVAEAFRVTRPGGTVLFSTYSSKIWEDRLAWFRDQARERLLGPIDESQTGHGTIVCRDGFRASALEPKELLALFRGLGSEAAIHEVDDSSVFCVATK